MAYSSDFLGIESEYRPKPAAMHRPQGCGRFKHF
jgi:hypothetical protein